MADAYVEYDPEAAADPAGALRAAAVTARLAERTCKHCTARQPARAHHCRFCDKCVHTFDHHCLFLNTCIGERNRCRFWFFMLAQSTTLAFAIGILNTGFVWRRSTGDWVAANIFILLSLIVLWIIQLVVFGLLVFHTWLACTNSTTFELVTGAPRLWYLAGTDPKECDIPYSHGLCTNLRLFCCTLDACPAASCGSKRPWVPRAWRYPGRWDRESEDLLNNLWENRCVC